MNTTCILLERKKRRILSLLSCILCCLLTFHAYSQSAGSLTEVRVNIASISPNINTGQDYAPWLNDDMNDLVRSVSLPINMQYVDVQLTFAARADIKRVSLYDYQGVFTGLPASIYAVNGTQRTLLGIFTGLAYMQWVDIILPQAVSATAIVIRKYGNNIPVKLKVFSHSATTVPVLVPSVITFPALAGKTVGNAPFDLIATSTNTNTPIAFTSSNPGVVSVSNATGNWQATIRTAGSVTITASQAASSSHLAAVSVARSLVVQAASVTRTGRIPIDPLRWYQATNQPDGIGALFDGNTSAEIAKGYGRVSADAIDAFYPLQAGETFAINQVKLYDGQGSNTASPMTLAVITDTWQRLVIGTFTGTQYQQWVGPYPAQPTRFTLNATIRNARYLVITAAGFFPTEIELYGSYTVPTMPPVPSASALAAQKQIQLKQCLGVNAFEWDVESPSSPLVIDTVRLNAVKYFTGIRHYLDWEKLESTRGSYTFNPSHSGGWNYDAMYERLKQENIEVLACLKTQPGWMQRTYPVAVRSWENVPVLYGRSCSAPASYLEQSKMVFQFAARYGRNKNVSRSLVRVSTALPRWAGDPVNQVKIGLDLVRYIECDNERDKWWRGRQAYQTAQEYAANMSAFYDGHKNTMGSGVGVKNADPTMQVVMGGLASGNPDYVKAMVDWCRQYRGYKPDGSVNLCWDVINYHKYANDAGSSQGANATRGAAPEVSNAGRLAKAFVLMAHQYAGGMPVWITETGYDFNQSSPLKAIAVGNRSVQETQADWTLRTALAYARWGVERTFMYQLYDDNALSPIKFSSMGLVNDDKTPRLAAQYLRQANQLIGNYTYKQTLNDDPVVDRYELNGNSAYVLVVPDEAGRTAAYTLDLGGASYADVYRPTTGQAMAVQRVGLQNGQLAIQVTETPVFVLPGSPAMRTAGNTCSATGVIAQEEWAGGLGRAGNEHIPTSTKQLLNFEDIRPVTATYSARVRGYICPPQTGRYNFRIASNDTSELWVSTSDSPDGKVLLAATTGPDSWQQLRKGVAKPAVTVNLVAGHRYYIEALYSGKTGTSQQMAVAWQLPDGTVEGPISGSHLSSYPTEAPPATNKAPTDSNTRRDILKARGGEAIELTAAPIPFSRECTIEFALKMNSQVELGLYDLHGRFLRQLFTGTVNSDDFHRVSLAGDGLSPGIYIIRLQTDKGIKNQRIILTR